MGLFDKILSLFKNESNPNSEKKLVHETEQPNETIIIDPNDIIDYRQEFYAQIEALKKSEYGEGIEDSELVRYYNIESNIFFIDEDNDFYVTHFIRSIYWYNIPLDKVHILTPFNIFKKSYKSISKLGKSYFNDGISDWLKKSNLGKDDLIEYYKGELFYYDSYNERHQVFLKTHNFDFIAIDVETANEIPSSICSIGLVCFRKGKIVKEYYSLVKPEPFYVNKVHFKIHGISENELIDKPSFDKVWDEIKAFIYGNKIVAHNASFDISTITKCLYYYDIDFTFDLVDCTYKMSRSRLELSNYKLPTVCDYFNVELKSHHNALDDAKASGFIYLKLLEIEPKKAQKTKSSNKSLSGNHTTSYQSTSGTLEGKKIAITGQLSSMERDEAKEMINNAGGRFVTSVSRFTDILVVGETNGHLSQKEHNAITNNVIIINERDFLKMLGK